MSRHYSDPSKESETYSLPDVEVFYSEGCINEPGHEHNDGDFESCNLSEAGWYWWYCFPGCLPEGDSFGPYESEQEAVDDMRRCCEEG